MVSWAAPQKPQILPFLIALLLFNTTLVCNHLKPKDEFEKMNEWSIEALAYPISHPGVIKILDTKSINHGSIHVVVEWWIFEEFLDKL